MADTHALLPLATLEGLGLRLKAAETRVAELEALNTPLRARVAALEKQLSDGGLDEYEQVRRMTAAMREADRDFERVGGSTRHHVRDCLLPVLEKHGLRLVAVTGTTSDSAPLNGQPGEEDRRG